jgi:hypothetical protein
MGPVQKNQSTSEHAERAEQDFAAAEASGDDERSKWAARGSRGVCKRVDDAWRLVMENAKATGLKLKSPLVESQALNHCRQASAQF